jgi:hypothetical protein
VIPRTPFLPLAVALAACRGAPPPAPATPEGAVVAIVLRTRAQRDPHAGRPTLAYFVRLGEGVDAARAGTILPSNHHANGVAYLLDALPGRYVAVACHGRHDGYEWTAYFPEAMVRATEKTVPAGKAVLLGDFDGTLHSISTPGDRAQEHYLRVISPNWEKRAAALKLFTRDEHAWVGEWHVASDVSDVVARMRKELGEAWADRFGP